MNAPHFLESLTNIPSIDYLHAHKERNPVFFLARARWFVKQFPELKKFLQNTDVIHLAGTSGKGSTGAFLQSIIAAQNTHVGFYHSPHVQHVYERIRIMRGAKLSTISPDEFEKLVSQMKPLLERAIVSSPYGLPSYFEILFTLALLYFKKINCTTIILEAGCGGRFDATNVIPQTKLAIITSIGYDHEHLIGPRLRDIAYEKAGIIKKNSTVLLGPTIKGKIAGIIQKEADKKNTLLFTSSPSLYSKETSRDTNDANQEDQNIIIAREAARLLQIPASLIRRGMKNARALPGRFQVIRPKPLIISDGAHNIDKINYLLEKLAPELQKKRKKILIFASVETKNWARMLTLLIPCFDTIYLTRHSVLQRKSADLKEMYRHAIKTAKGNKNVTLCIDPEDAFKRAVRQAHKKDLIVATGSLYMLGSLPIRNLQK